MDAESQASMGIPGNLFFTNSTSATASERPGNRNCTLTTGLMKKQYQAGISVELHGQYSCGELLKRLLDIPQIYRHFYYIMIGIIFAMICIPVINGQLAYMYN